MEAGLLPHWAIDYLTTLSGHFGGGRETYHWILWILPLIVGRQIEHALLCAKGARCRRVPTKASVHRTARALEVTTQQRASARFVEE
jgi:hypothetical protein